MSRNFTPENFDLREQAAARLQALGEEARPALEKALKSGDPDVRRLRAEFSPAWRRRASNYTASIPMAIRPQALRGELVTSTDKEEKVQPFKLNARGRIEFPRIRVGDSDGRMRWKGWIQDGLMNDCATGWSIEAHAGLNPVLIVLHRTGSAAGVIRDAQGRAAPGRKVLLFKDKFLLPDLLDAQIAQAALNMDFSTLSGADGSWEVDDLPEGVFASVVTGEGDAAQLGPLIRVRAGKTTRLNELTVRPKARGAVEFEMLKKDGSPAAKTRVSWSAEPIFEGPRAAERARVFADLREKITFENGELESDDKGIVRIENLAAGRDDFLFWATDEPVYVARAEVKDGETVRISRKDVHAPGEITGKMVASKNAVWGVSPLLLAEAELNTLMETARRQSGAWYHFEGVRNRKCEDNGLGDFHAENLVPGRYAIYIPQQSFSHAVFVFGIDVPAGKAVRVSDFKLPEIPESISAFSGIVHLPDGTPAEGAEVTWQCARSGLFITPQRTAVSTTPCVRLVASRRWRWKCAWPSTSLLPSICWSPA